MKRIFFFPLSRSGGFLYAIFLLSGACSSGHEQQLWKESRVELAAYRAELDSMRREFRVFDMPDVSFFLFGMGDREKFLYKDGKLMESFTGRVVKEWDVNEELIVPSLYRVLLKTKNGKTVLLQEDEKGFYLCEGDAKSFSLPGAQSLLFLPAFENKRFSRILKVLHQEILVNIVDGVPLPNYFVYKKGWRRDGAMMAICLEKTGNIDLIRSWVLDFSDPYDRNNAGEEEADNPGQTLYLLSLFADKNHPAVARTLEEVKKFERKNDQGKFIQGRSDFGDKPVYQTKFLKWGLKKIGLPDDYIIPYVQDDYATLFWWDYKDSYMPGTVDAYDKNDYYPYLGWAADHFHGLKRNPISNRDYPLTWEIRAGQANYEGMRIIDSQYTVQRIATPHTWHAAEIFLYLMDDI